MICIFKRFPGSSLAVALVGLLALTLTCRGDFPTPSTYPVSWELDYSHGIPRRIVVQVPGDPNPTAYWYMTYHMANDTNEDKLLIYPTFTMVADDGTIVHSDFGISPAVFQAIKESEKIKYLQNANSIGGELLHGEDQSKDGVAIWPEPLARMGTFSIFVSGLWGETAAVPAPDGKTIHLHKTLQLTWHVNGDIPNPTDEDLVFQGLNFVMR